MKTNILKTTGLAILGGSLFAASTLAIAGIANTKHNLGTGGTQTNHLSAGTAEICVFCHTPHGAKTDVVAPLWNKSVTDPTTFSTYDSLGTSTLDGETAKVGSVSIACLSCHDGSQAMDTVINAPGSGGYNASGATMSGATWTGARQSSGALAAGIITNLGTDLRNDHPVSIQYAGGGPKAADADGTYAGTLGDPDFHAPEKATINGSPVWWVDTEATANNTREKTDMQLYTRDGNTAADVGASWTGGAYKQPFVECASCHDPHVEDTGSNPTFLRISNDNSAVCLACHDK